LNINYVSIVIVEHTGFEPVTSTLSRKAAQV